MQGYNLASRITDDTVLETLVKKERSIKGYRELIWGSPPVAYLSWEPMRLSAAFDKNINCHMGACMHPLGRVGGSLLTYQIVIYIYIYIGWKSCNSWVEVLWRLDASLMVIGCNSYGRMKLVWRLDSILIVG